MDRLKVNPVIVMTSGFMLIPSQAHRLPATIDGYDDIYELYKTFMANGPNTGSYEFFKDACIRCAYTYGDFKQWVRLHAMSAKLTNTQFDFIIDTLKFIETGKRSMHITNWIRVIKLNPEQQVTEVEHKRRLNMIENFHVSSNPVPDWVSHEGGLADLILTTATLFGGIQER